MKKCSKWLLMAVFALCLGLLPQVQSQAAGKITGLRQTDAGTSTIKIAIDASLGALGYRLDLSQDGVTWVEVNTYSNNWTSLSASGLAAGKSYYARVCEIDYWNGRKEIPGTASDPIEVVTSPDGSISGLQTKATQTGFSVSISGPGTTGANYYQLTYNNELIGGGSSPVLDSNKALTPGTRYWCTLVACRRSSTGFLAKGRSDWLYLKTLSPAINTRNFGVTSVGSNSSNYVAFSASNSGRYTDGYEWQFATPGGKVKKTQSTAYQTLGISNFIKGNFYKYRVRTYINCGTSKLYGPWSSYKTIACPKKISLKLIKKSRSVKVSWSKVNNASKFDVLISTKENSGYKKVKTVSAKKRSVTIKKCGKKKLKKNTKYYVRIVPKAKIGKKTVKADVYMYQSFTITSYSVY